MRSRGGRIVAIVVWIALAAETGFSCKVGAVNGATPQTLEWTRLMVAQADVILRATAVEYLVQGTPRKTDSTVRFTVTEVVKGSYTAAELVLPGDLSEMDEWNPGPSPYTGPRATALRGSCFSYTYRRGGQFLLVLVGRGGGSSPGLLPLSPANEQLRSAEDPWLLWVRDELKPK